MNFLYVSIKNWDTDIDNELLQKMHQKKSSKNESTLTPSRGQAVQPINPRWGIFRKLFSLAIHWRIISTKNCAIKQVLAN